MLFADVILANGTIYSMSNPGEHYGALAISNGVVVGLADGTDIAEWQGSHTQVIDLNGGTALPGFTDVHVHLLNTTTMYTYNLDMSRDAGIDSIDSGLRALRDWPISKRRDGWILGQQYEDNLVAERRFPTRWELDSVSPDAPIFIRGVGQHTCSANSKALLLAGIHANSPDPAGGKFERDEHGELTGILHERGKYPVLACIPKFSVEEFEASLFDQVEQRLLRHGITSVGTMVDKGPDEVRAYSIAALEHDLPLRLNLLLRVAESSIDISQLGAVGMISNLGSRRLKIDGVKMSIDGAWRNAATYAPYPAELDNYGVVRIPQEELEGIVVRARQLGLRSAIHAIGPRAYDMALEALGKVSDAGFKSDFRDRVEHLGLMPMTDRQRARSRELGIIASTQPSFLYHLGEKFIDAAGEEAMAGGFCFRSLRDAGVRMVGSSDMNNTPANVLLGVQAAVTRRSAQGNVFGADESIPVYDALRLFTADAAYAQFEEQVRGTLQMGCLADVVVLAANPFDTHPEDLGSIPVSMTIVGGRIVYDRRGI